MPDSRKREDPKNCLVLEYICGWKGNWGARRRTCHSYSFLVPSCLKWALNWSWEYSWWLSYSRPQSDQNIDYILCILLLWLCLWLTQWPKDKLEWLLITLAIIYVRTKERIEANACHREKSTYELNYPLRLFIWLKSFLPTPPPCRLISTCW